MYFSQLYLLLQVPTTPLTFDASETDCYPIEKSFMTSQTQLNEILIFEEIKPKQTPKHLYGCSVTCICSKFTKHYAMLYMSYMSLNICHLKKKIYCVFKIVKPKDLPPRSKQCINHHSIRILFIKVPILLSDQQVITPFPVFVIFLFSSS